MKLAICIVVGIFISLHACAPQSSFLVQNTPLNAANNETSCAHPAEAKLSSNLALIGGQETSAYPYVLQVNIVNAAGQASSCTGSFHTDAVMIIAAHCLYSGNGKSPVASVRLGESGEPAVDWFWNPQYVLPGSTTVSLPPSALSYVQANISYYKSKYDLAAIRFNPSPAHQAVAISGDPRNVGQEVRMVGWGITADDLRSLAAGGRAAPLRKRTAMSRIIELYDDMVVLQEGGEGLLPRLAQGDSGGSVFDANSGLALSIVSNGILSSSAALQAAKADPILSQVGPRLGVTVDLSSPSALSFYTQIQQRWNLTVAPAPVATTTSVTPQKENVSSSGCE